MKIASLLFENNSFCKEVNTDGLVYEDAELVIGFGLRELVTNPSNFIKIRDTFPNAKLVLCSSAGEIYHDTVFNNTISLVALTFSTTAVKTFEVNSKAFSSSYDAGVALIKKFSGDNLKLVMIFSDGGIVNGSELVKGINAFKGENVLITGGLAGDGADFNETVVGLDQLPKSGTIVGIGFYGDQLQVSHGSMGGWESFGLERTVTKADGNVLYQIDEKNVLELYKSYLGKYTEKLPASALLFPLSIQTGNESKPIVRTILSIDEDNQSMIFAGDIPIGSKVRFMRSNFDRLIDAASQAASACLEMNNFKPKLALLISCVGRKLVLDTRTEEEIEAVSEILGEGTILSGFYSYGEISPLKPWEDCVLHNQTMTITCLSEID
ncbi:FIST N-terminal domain-containing protein [Flavobacterium sp. WV_118_3]|uniref:FIST signal transduction protein n=1 Tax=Flavobacterium sp. WV_118_3 TaxID=3151764 RepID=UPI00321BF45C